MWAPAGYCPRLGTNDTRKLPADDRSGQHRRRAGEACHFSREGLHGQADTHGAQARQRRSSHTHTHAEETVYTVYIQSQRPEWATSPTNRVLYKTEII